MSTGKTGNRYDQISQKEETNRRTYHSLQEL